ncbi:mitochondrial substrate carrier family protein [Planoprotostelium fungivorum]|uniref:Mitochondrial substrate carrier family protein n=1 Tax=Planoprotostelium fungivorum TaxID=1890364 RepID=A0A2P6N7C8_9EUKA|nr:mitochondrial substrate carrier family protein [Planoprotostelium fungivorum]
MGSSSRPQPNEPEIHLSNDDQSAVKDIVAGAFRGIAQVIVGHPLDTVKVRLQTQTKDHKFNGLWDCLKTTFWGLYKGAQSPLYMSTFYSAVLFVTYGQSKRLFHDSSRDTPGNPNYPLREMILIGGCSGFFAASVESPMDLVKSKMQVQFDNTHREYTSSVDCARKLVRRYGFFSLFQGWSAAVCRNIPGTITYFYTYESLRYVLPRNSKGLPTELSVIVAGGISGIIFWTAIFPFDVVKSRMQTDHLDREKRVYKTVWGTLNTLHRQGGMRSLYAGFLPCLIRAFPTNAASFLAYENYRKSSILKSWDNQAGPNGSFERTTEKRTQGITPSHFEAPANHFPLNAQSSNHKAYSHNNDGTSDRGSPLRHKSQRLWAYDLFGISLGSLRKPNSSLPPPTETRTALESPDKLNTFKRTLLRTREDKNVSIATSNDPLKRQ